MAGVAGEVVVVDLTMGTVDGSACGRSTRRALK